MGVVITRNSQLHGDGGDCEPLNLGRQVISFALTLKSNKNRTNLANAAKGTQRGGYDRLTTSISMLRPIFNRLAIICGYRRFAVLVASVPVTATSC